MILRSESPGDIPAIRVVNDLAFEGPNEAKIVDGLRKDEALTLSMVAVEGDEIVAYVAYSPVLIEGKGIETPAIGLGPVAVLPAQQRKGIGSKLIEASLKILRERGHKIVVVLGHPEYYPRFGFRQSIDYGIRCQWEVPPPVFMVLALEDGALNDVHGTVKYHRAFDGD